MGTWIVGIVFAYVLARAVISIYKNKKAGDGCGSCNTCSKE
ncbi:MAG: FeoB-associated Cys-rich membrane protein [Turicibacter sp.]|nr:FeoB-associated Cys-rich membrane protein [Turicibacter sp.]